jgi:hypothetical protein
MRSRLLKLFTPACCLFVAAAAYTQQHDVSHQMFTPDTVKWGPAPPSLPPGAQFAVLEGDPAKPGAFTMRAKLPDGYKIQPHWHPVDEHVTVVQGTFHVGLGEKFDPSAGKPMPAGSFALMKQGVRHFAWAKGETIVQLHGTGPWGINYVNPQDDPRKKTGSQD